MAKKQKEKKLNAKQTAYVKKQEESGKKVVAWIFGGLIVLAIFYIAFLGATSSVVNHSWQRFPTLQ